MSAEIRWTPDKVADLREMWLAGEMARVIAERLEVSPSAITRVVRRLNFPNRFDTERFHNGPQGIKPLKLVATPPARECQFITSNDKPWTFCGAKPKLGKSYCAHHHAICYRVVEHAE